jgi:hypothetical protein
MENNIRSYGFVPPVIIGGDEYILGGFGLEKKILQPDGNWEAYLPTYERQFNGNFDTFGCTVFGTLNAIEILTKKVCEVEANYAERYPYILAGVRPPGADPHKVAEAIRSKGVVNQELLPFSDTFDEFIKPDPMTKGFLDIGKKWLETNSFGHEWVFSNNPSKEAKLALLKEALQLFAWVS